MLQDGLVDKWSTPHFSIGVALALARVPWPVAFAGSVGWEFIENGLLIPAGEWDRETTRNAIADVFTNLAGYGLARWLVSKA